VDVIGWLLEGDPGIRWQVLRDLVNAPAGDVAAERARVEHDGWGARIHPGRVYFDLEGGVGTPSRWNTLRALRVLEWWDGTA